LFLPLDDINFRVVPDTVLMTFLIDKLPQSSPTMTYAAPPTRRRLPPPSLQYNGGVIMMCFLSWHGEMGIWGLRIEFRRGNRIVNISGGLTPKRVAVSRD